MLSDNLHEVHGYNRLAEMARGRVLVFMQDDELPPRGCGWAHYVLEQFGRHPRLGAIGALLAPTHHDSLPEAQIAARAQALTATPPPASQGCALRDIGTLST